MTKRAELSFDGKGINGPDEYRTRIATFTSTERAKMYGELFESAPEMLEALVRAERKLSAYVGVCFGDKELTDTVLPMVRAAIYKAQGVER